MIHKYQAQIALEWHEKLRYGPGSIVTGTIFQIEKHVVDVRFARQNSESKEIRAIGGPNSIVKKR